MVQEMIDGELSVRVFELIRSTEGTQQRQRYTLPSRQRMEIATVSFLQAFRKIYVGEQVMNTSKVAMCFHLASNSIRLQKFDVDAVQQDACKALGLTQEEAMQVLQEPLRAAMHPPLPAVSSNRPVIAALQAGRA